jgi:uncharacterized cupredoxin-like copper-binding protein
VAEAEKPTVTTLHRPGRIAILAGLGLSLGLAGIAAAWAGGVGAAPRSAEIDIHYSHFGPSTLTVPAGTPITILLKNTDPIDHEWIVGDAATHERHHTGTEPVHGSRPTEVSIPAGQSRETTVTFNQPGTYLYICHLPGHEAYGMVGTLVVTPG